MAQTLIVLGTGNALATRCYNTCFAIDFGGPVLLVDAGGGNGILRQLDAAHVDASNVIQSAGSGLSTRRTSTRRASPTSS